MECLHILIITEILGDYNRSSRSKDCDGWTQADAIASGLVHTVL